MRTAHRIAGPDTYTVLVFAAGAAVSVNYATHASVASFGVASLPKLREVIRMLRGRGMRRADRVISRHLRYRIGREVAAQARESGR